MLGSWMFSRTPPSVGCVIDTVAAGGSLLSAIGNVEGLTPYTDSGHYENAQSFVPCTGDLTEFTVDLLANVGAPTGDIRWSIHTDAAGEPSGTELDFGTFTPTASATNTITVTGGPALVAGTTYWLVLESVNDQEPENFWQWDSDITDTYADGNRAYRYAGGDLDTQATGGGSLSVIGHHSSGQYKNSQSFRGFDGDLVEFTVDLLASTGAPTGNIRWSLQTNAAGVPSGTELAFGTFTPDDDATNTITVVGGPTLVAGTTYWLVLESVDTQAINNYWSWKCSSSSSYSAGQRAYHFGGSWTAQPTVDNQITVSVSPTVNGPWNQQATVDNQLTLTTV